MNIVQNLVDPSKYNIKCPYEMDPQYITIHNTANDASAQNEIKYMITNDNQVSFHFAIDDIEVVQGVPTNRCSWNSGDGADGTGNRKSIAIEICYSKSGGDRFIKAEQNCVKFVAQLLKERGWGIDRIKKHQDWNGKYCPHRTLDMGWNRFLKMIETELNSGSNKEYTEEEEKIMLEKIEALEKRVTVLENERQRSQTVVSQPTQKNIGVGSVVTLSPNATVYQGASLGVAIPGSKKGKQYTVQQVKNDIVLLQEIMSWVLVSEVY